MNIFLKTKRAHACTYIVDYRKIRRRCLSWLGLSGFSTLGCFILAYVLGWLGLSTLSTRLSITRLESCARDRHPWRIRLFFLGERRISPPLNVAYVKPARFSASFCESASGAVYYNMWSSFFFHRIERKISMVHRIRDTSWKEQYTFPSILSLSRPL